MRVKGVNKTDGGKGRARRQFHKVDRQRIRAALRQAREHGVEEVEILPGYPAARAVKIEYRRALRVPWRWHYYFGDKGGWDSQEEAVSAIVRLMEESDAERDDRL